MTTISGETRQGRLGQRYANAPETLWIRTGGSGVETFSLKDVEKIEVLKGTDITETIRVNPK